MPLLVIYSMPAGTKCPPKVEDDLGARVKIGDPWGQYESGNPTVYTQEVPDNSDVFIHAMHPLKPGRCTWVPTGGGLYQTRVGTQTATFCVPCTCREAASLIAPMSGTYGAKRSDQAMVFPIEMTFRVNSTFCLVCDIHAPGKLDQAVAFLHTKPERGNHGTTHPGDFMNNNAPLTEGFLQGTFRGSHGEQGTLRMILGLVPVAAGMFHVHFGGYLSFGGGPNIETVFQSIRPVRWPGGGPAA